MVQIWPQSRRSACLSDSFTRSAFGGESFVFSQVLESFCSLKCLCVNTVRIEKLMRFSSWQISGIDACERLSRLDISGNSITALGVRDVFFSINSMFLLCSEIGIQR